MSRHGFDSFGKNDVARIAKMVNIAKMVKKAPIKPYKRKTILL